MTETNRIKRLRTFIEKRACWKLRGDSWESLPTDGEVDTFSNAEFAYLDPRLPVVLEALHLISSDYYQQQGFKNEAFLSGQSVYATLELWRGAYPQLAFGRVSHLYDIIDVVDDSDGLTCEAWVYYPKQAIIDDVYDRIQYIDGCTREYQLPLSAEWLDQTYPDWQQRYLALTALGESPTSAAKQACVVPGRTIPVPMSDVQFP